MKTKIMKEKLKTYYYVLMTATGYMLPAFIFGVLYEAIQNTNFLLDRGLITLLVVYTVAILMLYITFNNHVKNIIPDEDEEDVK